ncbi:golgin subfamily A member 6-like protein 6 [Haliotis rubra]|uniref:golgin subfamily A member 6-like protein 6 n=1 Tax=Haliotis rubra TaxID=36100 RepID=UPI001EE4F2F1|nr:golgin subfamily A member 6-like protein 6 [Haliotis rubra]
MSEYEERFWGIGYGLGFTKNNSDAWDTDCWNGKNVLGYILTTVRDGLMEKEKRKTELDVEGVSLQGTLGGEWKQDGKTILMEESWTMNKAMVGGEEGNIKEVEPTSKDEERVVSMKIGRTDESRLLGGQDVKENWDDEMEEVTSSQDCESENKDAHTAFGCDKGMMEKDQRARNSVGEEDKFELVPVKGEDGGTEEQDVGGLYNTDVGEGNSVEQQKVEKNDGKELGKIQEVKTTEDVTSVPDTSKEYDDEGRTIHEREEKKSNGTMQEVKTTEDFTSVPDTSKEDDDEGRTIHEREEKKRERRRKVMAQCRKRRQQKMSHLCLIPQRKMMDEGRTIHGREEKKSNSTMQKVKTTEDFTSLPDTSKEDDDKGGRYMRERRRREDDT